MIYQIPYIAKARAGVFGLSRKKERSTRTPPLPSNIIQEILTRLNAKALMRFKCVCKAWLQLISCPSFLDLHCSISQQHNVRLFFRSSISYDNHSGFSYRFFSLKMNPNGRHAIHTSFTAYLDGPIKLILPSCWGLICFATETRIYVYNPSTLRLLALPPFPGMLCGFGFGYMESSKCYKVVRLIYGESNERIECSVLQLQRGANSELSWRVLQQACPCSVDEYNLPTFAQQTIYWNIKQSQTILSFNIEEDEFSIIPHPSNWIYASHDWTQLVHLDGMLCMLQISITNVVIWVHRDQQWYRGGDIDFTGINRELLGQVICIKDNIIIFSSLSDLVLFYDIKTGRFKRQQIPYAVNGLGIYCESLFPLGDSH